MYHGRHSGYTPQIFYRNTCLIGLVIATTLLFSILTVASTVASTDAFVSTEEPYPVSLYSSLYSSRYSNIEFGSHLHLYDDIYRFEQWAEAYGQRINNPDQYSEILDKWVDNDQYIELVNSMGLTFTLAHNRFSGMDSDEYRAWYRSHLSNVSNKKKPERVSLKQPLTGSRLSPSQITEKYLDPTMFMRLPYAPPIPITLKNPNGETDDSLPMVLSVDKRSTDRPASPHQPYVPKPPKAKHGHLRGPKTQISYISSHTESNDGHHDGHQDVDHGGNQDVGHGGNQDVDPNHHRTDEHMGKIDRCVFGGLDCDGTSNGVEFELVDTLADSATDPRDYQFFSHGVMLGVFVAN